MAKFITGFLLFLLFLQSGSAQSPVTINGATKSATLNTSVRNYAENTKNIEFIVDADGKVIVTVRTIKFRIEKGKKYSVNLSYQYPQIITASDNNTINFTLDTAENCTVVIEPLPGENLLANSGFESVAGWVGLVENKMYPSRPWEFAGLSDTGELLTNIAGLQVNRGSTAATTLSIAHSGSNSFCLNKATDLGTVALRSAKSTPVETGKKYMVSCYYSYDHPQYGSIFHFYTIIQAPGKKDIYQYDENLNPLVYNDKGTWRRTSFLFNVPDDYKNAGVKVFFIGQHAPFTVYIDDVELRLAPSPAKQYSKPLTKEQIAPKYSVEEVRNILHSRANYEVKAPRALSTPLTIDNKPTALYGFTTDWQMDSFPQFSANKDFIDAGVRLHWITLETNIPSKWGPQIWQADGQFDFSAADSLITRVLRYDPSIYLQLYLNMYPYKAFGDVHPEAAWVNARGSKVVGEKDLIKDAKFRKDGEYLTTSLTAPAYREQCVLFLKALGKYLSTHDVGKAVIGVHLIGGTDGQWFYPGWKEGEGGIDQSEGNLVSYRKWLQKKYRTVDSLQKAWNDPAVNFDNIKMPPEAARCADKYYLSPKTDQPTIDANRYIDAGVSESINLFAKTIKEAMNKNILVTIYYPNKLYALQDWIEAPYVDGTVAVEEYGSWRNPGQTGEIATIPGSLKLHGKYFLSELDYRTENASSFDMDANNFVWVITKGSKATANIIRRSAGEAFTKGGGVWHYSLTGNSWNGRDHMAYITEMQKAASRITNIDSTDIGQIAVFVDETAGTYITCPGVYTPFINYQANYYPRMAFNRSGVTWDNYLLSDLENPKLPNYKVYAFMSGAAFTTRQIQFIQQHLQQQGKILLFFNNAGYFEKDGFEKNITKLTGMTIKQTEASSTNSHYIPIGTDKLSRGIEQILSETAGPLYYVDDPDATPLATITNTNKVGAAVKRNRAYTAVYGSLIGGISPEFVRNIAIEAGITPVGPLDDVTYAGNGILVIHALRSGKKELTWGKKCNLVDLSTGITIAENINSIQIDMGIHETRWFQKVNIVHE
jgi:Beta-galactosidase/Carbohydrate binding domain